MTVGQGKSVVVNTLLFQTGVDLHSKKNARDLIWSRAEMGLFVFQGFYFFGG